MNRSFLSVMILLTVLALAACNRNDDADSISDNRADPAAAQASESAAANPATDSAFDSSFEGALPPTNQMMLGILRLEDTEHAVTSAQAAAMLPLWQALQSGSIQNQSERVAILRQLEGQFTQPQVEAISALQLTFADMNDWAEANGIERPQFGQGGQGSQGGQGRQSAAAGQGGPGGIFADMSEEERAAFRQEMQNMSPEQRTERLQELGVEIPANAGAEGPRAGQAGPRAGGRFGILMTPLIELLQARATL